MARKFKRDEIEQIKAIAQEVVEKAFGKTEKKPAKKAEKEDKQ